MDLSDLPESWVVWSDESDGRAVLAYRPDVFDSDSFPAPCMPTIYVTRGSKERRRPPGEPTHPRSAGWRVTLFLEPEVTLPEESFDTRAAALSGAVEVARSFDGGEVNYRGAYQVPRDAYLDRLDELTGRDDGSD